jgi:2-hydroxy-6-oxonona-2,4-dienedioate hydrolase
VPDGTGRVKIINPEVMVQDSRHGNVCNKNRSPQKTVRFVTDIDGIKIHVRTVRDAGVPQTPVVILVHGLIISSLYMLPTLRRLARFVRVYAPDLPGYGRSSKLRHAPTVSELADFLALWMDAVGISSACLVGNSYGCNIVAEFALRHPDRIEKAVLLGPTTDPQARTFFRQLIRMLKISRFERPSIFLLVFLDLFRAGLRTGIESISYALSDRIEDKLPKIKIPTLVVRGSNDLLVPQRWAEQVAALLPYGQLKVIAGVGHAANYSAPIELVKVLRPFLTV